MSKRKENRLLEKNGMSKKEAYDTVINDAKIMSDFIMGLPDDCDLSGCNIPAQFRVYFENQSGDEVIVAERIKINKVAVALGGSGALLATAGISAATTIGGASVAIGGTALGAAAGIAAAPVLPILAVGGAAAFLIKKYINRKDVENVSKRVAQAIEKIRKSSQDRADKYKKNAEEFAKSLSDKAKDNAEKAKKISSHIAILLDDMTHNNVNKRIQQYNQIVLDQYNTQAELANEFAEIVLQYNKLLDENRKLIQEIEMLNSLLYGLNDKSLCLNSFSNIKAED